MSLLHQYPEKAVSATHLDVYAGLDGRERFRSGGTELGLTLLDFWRWSESDLHGTTTRGRLAEFIVATLLEASPRIPRADGPFTCETPDGVSVRVKSASVAHDATPRDLSRVYFAPLVWRASLRGRGDAAELPSARAYVFALFRPPRTDASPLDLDYWTLYVPPTDVLEAKMKEQRALSLAGLEALSGGPTRSSLLRAAVRKAAGGISL